MGSIKKELLSGVFYTAIAKYSGILISLIITGVLARLISPDKFGIVAVVTVITFFFSIFSDLGIGAAIIQNKELIFIHGMERVYLNTIIFPLLMADFLLLQGTEHEGDHPAISYKSFLRISKHCPECPIV